MSSVILIMVLICLSTLTCSIAFIMYRDVMVRKEKQDFDKQMIMAQSAAKVTTSFDDAFKIIDKLIMVTTLNQVTSLNLRSKTPEQLSVILEDVIIEASAHVLLNISEALKRQLFNYITEDYLKKYITDNSKKILIIHIENRGGLRAPEQNDKKI